MGLERFDLSDIDPAAQPQEEILVSERQVSDGRVGPVLRCAICGVLEDRADSLPIGYANPVCKGCDGLAVNEAGESPWIGWAPDERPEPEPGVIRVPPDDGENPVYIAGVKCWRRYRFGGHITRRDAFDCDSLAEFHGRHRVDGEWIHAFNTPQPNGVDITRERCATVREHRMLTKRLLAHARLTQHEAPTQEDVDDLREEAADLERRLSLQLPDPDEMPVETYLAELLTTVDEVHTELEGRAQLCDRYYTER